MKIDISIETETITHTSKRLVELAQVFSREVEKHAVLHGIRAHALYFRDYGAEYLSGSFWFTDNKNRKHDVSCSVDEWYDEGEENTDERVRESARKMIANLRTVMKQNGDL